MTLQTNEESATPSGVDEAEPPRTPSAWMMLGLVLALRQVMILVWVNFRERKWVIHG
jgi:hypothetical protein